MNDHDSLAQLLTLQSWMSAAFPTGAYSCSMGLETAIQDGRVRSVESCQDWISSVLVHGSGWNDCVILAHAYRATCTLSDDREKSMQSLRYLNELSLALQPGAERMAETTRLGSAFLDAASAWGRRDQVPWNDLGTARGLPLVIGALGAVHDMPLRLLAASSLQSMTSNLAWIATRLVPLGQSSCLRLIAALAPLIHEITDRAIEASLDDLGSSTLLADLASLQHERLPGRVCQT